jgi:radical SAM superfamily enzyme with C-terminal helix-hairpin-helix motif
MRTPAFTVAIVGMIGCNASPHSRQQVRQETAAATATVVSGVKGAAEGIKDGLHRQIHPVSPPIDINTATRPNLEVLPGITPPLARKIIAHRPYATPDDMRNKHVLTQAQLDAISTRITTKSN